MTRRWGADLHIGKLGAMQPSSVHCKARDKSNYVHTLYVSDILKKTNSPENRTGTHHDRGAQQLGIVYIKKTEQSQVQQIYGLLPLSPSHQRPVPEVRVEKEMKRKVTSRSIAV